MLRSFLLFIFIFAASWCNAQIKILFDNTKAETAANADWVIDADLHNMDWSPTGCTGCGGNEANPQKIPTPAQSGITASTPETYWTGALSYWATDCAKQGYVVETLPYTGQITYGSMSNTQDLSNYKIFIVDEPNILFTAAQKTAIMNFILNGGSLFMISDHTVSDRNNDGYDSPAIWNDLISNNGVLNNGFGFSVDLANFSQTSSNIIASASDSLIHGPFGNVTQVKWSNGTSITLNPSQNTSVKGVVYMTGSSGNTGVMCAYARLGCGKVVFLGDSSPPDDGTGDPNDVLYNGYITDAAGNHQKLIMNATIWLAEGNCTSGVVPITEDEEIILYPNPCTNEVSLNLSEGAIVNVFDVNGNEMDISQKRQNGKMSLNTSDLPSAVYFCKISVGDKLIIKKLFILP